MKRLLNFIYGLLKITLGLILILSAKDFINLKDILSCIIGVITIYLGMSNLDKATD